MEQYISCSEHKAVIEAEKWLGYLEHQDGHFIGLYNVNIGKGGYNAFAEIVRQYCKRNLQGLPWCAVFIYAVFLKVYGKKKTKALFGRPHASTRSLLRAMKHRGRFKDNTYIPREGDIIFLANDGLKIDHCGIVARVDGDNVICIDGNTVDPIGHFEPKQGGAVAYRTRKIDDIRIKGYGVTGGEYNADI